jgi:hypothetical protein
MAENPFAIVRLVRKLAQAQSDEASDRFKTLITIWAGDISVEAERESIEQIVFDASTSHGLRVRGLDAVVALEVLAALSQSFDKLDVESAAALAKIAAAALRLSDCGMRATTDYRRWIASKSIDGEDLDLAFDPFSLMDAIHQRISFVPLNR